MTDDELRAEAREIAGLLDPSDKEVAQREKIEANWYLAEQVKNRKAIEMARGQLYEWILHNRHRVSLAPLE